MGMMINRAMAIAQSIIPSVEPTSRASSALLRVGVGVAVVACGTAELVPKATLRNAEEMPMMANKIMRMGEESFFILYSLKYNLKSKDTSFRVLG
jgi:hypothetical protein